MKKILYLLLTIVTVFVISSYTNTSTIDKKVTAGDSISVNINVHQTKTPQLKDNNLYEKYLQSNIDVNISNIESNKAKQLLYDKILSENKNQNITTLDRLCYERGYDTNKVIQMANKDITWHFISAILIILLTIWIIIYFILKSIRDKLDKWIVIVFSIVILIGLYYINNQVPYILTYIFNHEYLTIKEIIKFF